ncbi:MAG: DUF4145 domain-containing protein [Nanoarchaeota archaeon]|nr:DUF4145 domain-containing protein [Nanoarchaeota archaeon]
MPSFEEIIGLAMQLKHIEDLKLNLKVSFNGALLVALYFENETEEKERKDVFFNRNKELIENLNEEIKKFNLELEKKYSFLPTKPLEIISLEKIKEIIYEHRGIDPNSREYTILKLNNCLNGTENSIKNFFDSFEIQLMPFLGRKLPKDIGEENYKLVKEAFDIYSLGYFETSVFIMGKCLEKCVTEFIKKNIEKGKIKNTLKELDKWNFDTKINILKKEKLISDTDYSKIMSIKWDRNTSGHPSKKDEIEKLRRDSNGVIILCINKIVDFSKRLEDVKSDVEIEQDKTREILGGRSFAGSV